MVGIGEAILTFFNAIGSFFQSLLTFFAKIPQLFRIISYGVNTLLTCFNLLPDWFFILGSVTLLVAVLWIVVEII